MTSPETTPKAETEARSLYHRLLASWNRRDADAFSALFATDGAIVGFDGSQVTGREEIGAHLRPIFADHPTAAYVGKVEGVTALAGGTAVLRAIAGMVPPGRSDIDPELNAVQSLVVARRDGPWGIVLFHNTPAQFHGRPHLVEEMTRVLRQVLEARADAEADSS
jgi:uncharacterized protein (TIGR02246 family)